MKKELFMKSFPNVLNIMLFVGLIFFVYKLYSEKGIVKEKEVIFYDTIEKPTIVRDTIKIKEIRRKIITKYEKDIIDIYGEPDDSCFSRLSGYIEVEKNRGK